MSRPEKRVSPPDKPDSVLVLQEFDWSGLIRGHFFESMLLGIVGVAIALTSLERPAGLLIDPWLSALCVVLAFTRVWKTIREESETMKLWELVLQKVEGEKLRDRVFEIPYIFSLMILPFAAISAQAFMLVLLVFYLADNYYNGALANAIAERGRRIRGIERRPAAAASKPGSGANPPFVLFVLAALPSTVMLRVARTGHRRTDAMVDYFRTRSRLNAAFVAVLIAAVLGVSALMAAGQPGTAFWVAASVLAVILLVEWLFEPGRNRRMTFVTIPDEFQEIVDPEDPLLEAFWLPLYRDSFPPAERVDETEHRDAVRAPDQHLLVPMDDGVPIGMARYDIVDKAGAPPYAYLMYMAIDKASASKGNGRRLFREIVRSVGEDPRQPSLIVLEVEKPGGRASPEAHQDPDRRVDFYRRQGCLVLGGVEYVQHVEGQPGVSMLIMARPLLAGVTAEAVFGAARDQFGTDVCQVGDLTLS